MTETELALSESNIDGRLIKSTRFEGILANIKAEQDKHNQEMLKEFEKNKTNELVQNEFRKIFRSIMSIYFYLRKVHNMDRRDLSIEEYEATRDHLKEMGVREVNKLRNRLFGSLGIKTGWHYYLEYGYFKIGRTPFGWWYRSHPLFSHEGFDPFERSDQFSSGTGNYSYCIPPNMKVLMEELFKKQSCGGKDSN